MCFLMYLHPDKLPAYEAALEETSAILFSCLHSISLFPLSFFGCLTINSFANLRPISQERPTLGVLLSK